MWRSEKEKPVDLTRRHTDSVAGEPTNQHKEK